MVPSCAEIEAMTLPSCPLVSSPKSRRLTLVAMTFVGGPGVCFGPSGTCLGMDPLTKINSTVSFEHGARTFMFFSLCRGRKNSCSVPDIARTHHWCSQFSCGRRLLIRNGSIFFIRTGGNWKSFKCSDWSRMVLLWPVILLRLCWLPSFWCRGKALGNFCRLEIRLWFPPWLLAAPLQVTRVTTGQVATHGCTRCLQLCHCYLSCSFRVNVHSIATKPSKP